MLDIRFIRENAERVQLSAEQKGYTVSIAKLLQCDDARRELQQQVDELRERRNQKASKMKGGRPEQSVIDEGRQIKEVARNVGVHEMTLGKWVKKARDAQDGEPVRPLNEDERSELERLRSENRRLKMEAEFAKKVAAWFAKDQQ